jgi:hypothetical protein
MGRRSAALAALAVLGACGPRPPRRDIGIPVAGTTVEIQAVIQAALRLDAAGDRAADTLYASEAVVVANARQRFAAPRFAGVSYGGRIAIGSASVTVEGRWAWAAIDYRWIGSQAGQIEVGRATLVAVKRDRGWRLVHVHSSLQLPWDR